MPMMGTKGTHGERNGRSASGWAFRIMRTAAHTMINANRVPMFVSSARMRRGRNAAIRPTNKPVMIVDFQGVRSLGWIALKMAGGTIPSLAIANKTRG